MKSWRRVIEMDDCYIGAAVAMLVASLVFFAARLIGITPIPEIVCAFTFVTYLIMGKYKVVNK
jgi:hypothetical protein